MHVIVWVDAAGIWNRKKFKFFTQAVVLMDMLREDGLSPVHTFEE